MSWLGSEWNKLTLTAKDLLMQFPKALENKDIILLDGAIGTELDKRGLMGRASLARKNFKRAGVDNMVTLVMGDAHETVTKIKEPIDVLFIDADKEGYTDYLKKLLPLVRPGGLILSHNIDMVGQGFIDAITKNPNLETVQAQGVTMTLKKRQSK